ncbi:MAG: 1-(5-phosphoribosyl)-5-[(5-phosphoribosylamino)methylideneamino]imidazole-4-carboxamide isomerase [Gammaproteobacteria bacterium]
MLVIPAIDLKGGKCVRLQQGRMDKDTVYSGDPIATAARWVEAGARRLHIIDLDGAVHGRPVNAEVIHRIAERFPDLPIQVGGGIRSEDTIQSYLDAGVSFVIIGTKAVTASHFVSDACMEFPGHIIVGLDVKDGRVAIEGWSKLSRHNAAEIARQLQDDGVTAIIYTDVSRDGMMKGVNVDATVELARSVTIPVFAAGGITTIDDIRTLCAYAADGIAGAVTGRAIYEGSLDLRAAQQLADELSPSGAGE